MADKTSKTIETLIRARYPLIYVVSFEEERVCNAISKIAAQRTKQLYQWSVTDGLLTPDGTYLAEFKDPLKVLEYILQMDVNGLFILKDYHPFMNDPVVIRKLRDLGKSLKLSMKNVIFLSPMLKIPGELEKELTNLNITTERIAILVPRKVIKKNYLEMEVDLIVGVQVKKVIMV